MLIAVMHLKVIERHCVTTTGSHVRLLWRYSIQTVMLYNRDLIVLPNRYET